MEKDPSLVAQEEVGIQMEMLTMLTGAPLKLAIGCAASFLLHCVFNHKTELRRVLNEPVIRDGYRGTSLIKELMRVSR